MPLHPQERKGKYSFIRHTAATLTIFILPPVLSGWLCLGAVLSRCRAVSMPLTGVPRRAYNVITFDGEDYVMKTRLIRIGNSRGIRLPKPLIAQAGLTDEVDLHVRDGAIVIERTVAPRAGWAQAAGEMRERDEDLLLDPPTATQFDEKEWEW